MKLRPLLVIGAGIVAACSGIDAPPLVVTDLEITRAAPGMMMSAGYMTISNNSPESIEITAVSSPQFGVVEMHETVIEDDVSRMRKLDSLTIPAGESLAFERGGKHLMLTQPTGINREVTLHVHSGDTVLLTITTDLTGN